MSKWRCDEEGNEIVDSTPMQPPVGLKRPRDLMDSVRSLIRSEMFNRQMAAAGHETFEEADDFEVEDDDTYDPRTPYEVDFDPPAAAAPPPAKPPAKPKASDVVAVPEGGDADAGEKAGKGS